MHEALTTAEIVYRVAGSGPLLATIYRPPGSGPLPGVVSVHGGRWCAETRLTNASLDRAVAQAGAVVMAVDFGMPPRARYPEPIADINLAIRWFKRHAATWDVAADRIGGLGTSSGGHQLLLNALKPDDPRYAAFPLDDGSAVDASLAFVIACWPVVDPAARYAYAVERGMQLHVDSHRAYWPDEASMGEGSPQRIVRDGEASRLPPLLAIHGGADVIVVPRMVEDFVASYRAAGGEAELRMFEGEPHTFMIRTPDSPSARRARELVCDYVRRQAVA